MRASKTPTRLCRRHCLKIRLRCKQLRHIEPSNAVSLPSHTPCARFVLLKYRASAQFHALVRADVKGNRLLQPSGLSFPITGFTLAWIRNRGRARLVPICLTVNSPTSQLWRTSWTSWLPRWNDDYGRPCHHGIWWSTMVVHGRPSNTVVMTMVKLHVTMFDHGRTMCDCGWPWLTTVKLHMTIVDQGQIL